MTIKATQLLLTLLTVVLMVEGRVVEVTRRVDHIGGRLLVLLMARVCGVMLVAVGLILVFGVEVPLLVRVVEVIG
jgi:hypothetical protein